MSFFATPLGVKVGAGLAAAATAGGFAAAWLPHTLFIEKYRDVMRFYKHGYPLQLSDEIQSRAQSVLADTKINEIHKKHISFFHVATIEPFFAGTAESGYGAIVGIPVTFRYKSVADVPVEELVVLKKEGAVPWDSLAGKILKEAFVFSEEAQKYAIAQHIYMSESNYVTLNSIVSAGGVLNTYLFSRFFNRRAPGLPFWGRCAGYGLSAFLCFVAWLYVGDMTTYSRERSALESAVSLGPEYGRGAVEYYEKVLARNKALRVILGKEGASKYTVKGNPNTLIRTPHMPLNACLDYAKQLNTKYGVQTKLPSES